jgi:threonine synthase
VVITTTGRPADPGTAVERNPALSGVQCIRCGTQFPAIDHLIGCKVCARDGHGSNVYLRYLNQPADPQITRRVNLPYTRQISLGEGGTPLIDAPDLGVLSRACVRLKLEGCNPTGSHKDRFAAMAVSRAVEGGYSEVVAASSGNAGIAIATYAGRAGLGCIIAVTDDVPVQVQDMLRRLGAEVRSFTDQGRWEYVAGFATSRSALPLTNFHLPTVGSHAFGIEGFKVIAEELLAQSADRTPDWVVVPSSRGDLGWGIHLGFRELLEPQRRPRIALVEPYPRLDAVLDAGQDYRSTFPGRTEAMASIAGNTATYQGLITVRESGGAAVVVTEADALDWNARCWRSGIAMEASSTAALAATDQLLRAGQIQEDASVVVITTAHGFKGL